MAPVAQAFFSYWSEQRSFFNNRSFAAEAEIVDSHESFVADAMGYTHIFAATVNFCKRGLRKKRPPFAYQAERGFH
jgi:hypothetical protein